MGDSGWQPSSETCPRCYQETEKDLETDEDGIVYNRAERCTECRWIVDFEADFIEVKHY